MIFGLCVEIGDNKEYGSLNLFSVRFTIDTSTYNGA